MRRKVAVIGGIAAGVTTLALVATPAIAQSGVLSGNGMFGRGANATAGQCPMADDATDTNVGAGSGRGFGMGGRMGAGMGAGSGVGMGRGGGMMGLGASTAAKGTLTDAQKTALAGIAQEEKLAHDLYIALGAKYPSDVQFTHIARAESMHLTAVRTLLDRYGIADPTKGQAAGVFTSAAVQDLYDSLLAGATDSTKALAAGVTVEKADIAAINKALVGVTAPDAKQVYTNLRAGSERHLAAFNR
jgi:hypothetical protein